MTSHLIHLPSVIIAASAFSLIFLCAVINPRLNFQGHTNCGGAAACYAAATGNPGPIPSESPLGQWLERLTQLAKDLQLTGGSAKKSDGEEEKAEDVEAKEKAELGVLVEENVKIQVENIANSKTMIDAWAADRQGTPVRLLIIVVCVCDYSNFLPALYYCSSHWQCTCMDGCTRSRQV